jgi:hypothetical protein
MNAEPALDAALSFHVKQFVPDAEGKELAHRIALLRARDWAAALRGRTASWLATECACHAHEIAGQFVFCAEASVARLEIALQLCRALVKAAMAADSLSEDI